VTDIADSLRLAFDLLLRGDTELLGIVALSLRVSLSACLIGAIAGLLAGAALAATRFPGHGVLVWAVNTLLALPSVVVGLLVYLLLSRSGPLGSWGILFTPTAMVVAQSILVVPLIAALTRRLVLDGLREGGDQLRSMPRLFGTAGSSGASTCSRSLPLKSWCQVKNGHMSNRLFSAPVSRFFSTTLA